MKLLYHYTSIERWHLIADSGRLNTTESNLSPRRPHAGPDVVWLTTDPDCRHGHGIRKGLDGTDKTRIRISVQLHSREVHRWLDWAARHGIDADWRRTLIEVSGGGVSSWRVTEKPIRPTRWREVIDRREGTVLWQPEG